MAIAEHSPFVPQAAVDRPRYVRAPRPIHFPVCEEMPETNRHLELRTLLYQLLKHELAERATVGSDQFVYYDPTSAKRKLAPDAFVKLGEPHRPFRVWKTWRRGAPEVAVEVVSDSDEGDEEWEIKLERYRAAGIEEVVRFDPDDVVRPIRVWDHMEGDLVERALPEDGVFTCTALGLYWVALPHPLFDQVLRLARDRAGKDLVPTPVEAEARARQNAERAQQDAERAQQDAERARQNEARARQEAEGSRDALAAEVAELRRKLAEATSGAKAPAPPEKARAPRQTRRAKPPGMK